jgi:hypothetical protein
MARPTKLTPEVQKQICEAIRHGATFDAAAQSAGVAYETFNEWRKDTRIKFVKFSEAVKRAEADGQLDLLERIETAGKNDWRSAAWVLEHRHKKDFGAAVDVTSKGEKLGADDTDTKAEILRKLDGIAAATGAGNILVQPDPDTTGIPGA